MPLVIYKPGKAGNEFLVRKKGRRGWESPVS